MSPIISRHRTATSAVLFFSVTSLVLAGCGSTSTEAEDSGASRTVDTMLGEVTVPETIESVVVLEGRRDTDIALALDLPVVGYPTRDPADAYELREPLADELDEAAANGAQELFLVDEINIEAIAQVAPTLIVARNQEVEPIAAELEAIAPVIALGNQGNPPWQVDLMTVAEGTGTEAKATELIDAYDARVADIKARYATQIASTKVAPFEYDSEGTDTSSARLQSRILLELGAQPAAAFAESIAANEAAAPEEADAIERSAEQTFDAYSDAGAILVFVTTAETWAALQNDPLWTALPAVQAGNVVRTDRLTSEGGPITAMAILDALEQLYATV